jgi:putative flippase GtrA
LIYLARQFAGFSAAGVAAAVVQYSLLIALVEADVSNPVQANLVAYTVGGAVNYYLNYRFTFRSNRAHTEAAWRFAVVAGFGFLFTGLFTYLFNVVSGVPYIPAAIMTSAVVLFWHFFANRLWTFRP